MCLHCVDLTPPWGRPHADASAHDDARDVAIGGQSGSGGVYRALDAADGEGGIGGGDSRAPDDDGSAPDGDMGGSGMGSQPGSGGVGQGGDPSGDGGSAGGTGGMTGTGGTGGGSEVPPRDAGPDAPAAPPDTAPLRCTGILDSGICWYLGKSGDSCARTCVSHGGTSPQAASHVGISSQGGSLSECRRLLGLLGVQGTVLSATRSDDTGLGCLTTLGLCVWLSSPAYSDSSALTNAQLVCGCLQ